MKFTSRFVSLLLLAALPLSLFSQGQTVIAAYMNVKTTAADYLEVENTWKKIHQKAVAEGYMNGWQLWRKMHVGTDDPYQFITLQWYNDYKHAMGADVPDGWMQTLFTDEEWQDLYDKTIASRDYVSEDVSHLVTMAENSKSSRFLVLGKMKVKPQMQEEYVKMETEIFKPLMEERIRRGGSVYWGIWNVWPYKEGQCQYVAVNGYSDLDQMTSNDITFDPKDLGMDYTWEEIRGVALKTRVMAEVEIWELVDAVFPEE